MTASLDINRVGTDRLQVPPGRSPVLQLFCISFRVLITSTGNPELQSSMQQMRREALFVDMLQRNLC